MTTHRGLTVVLLVIGVVTAIGQRTLAQTTIHVDDDAPLGSDGTTWGTAYKHLQDALAVAAGGDEIRVAGGTYRPDQDEAGNVTPGNREATFQLVSGVSIYAGYAGLADPTEPDRRNVEMFVTVLSGDLAGNDGPNFANNGENSYHVATGSDTDGTAILDGFTITAGNANGPPPSSLSTGGGISNRRGSPTLTNCKFTANSAELCGGGMESVSGSPVLINCTFTRNTGGGMSNWGGSPTLVGCSFSANSGELGAGMYTSGDPSLTACSFTGNRAEYGGGGLFNYIGNPTLTNCTFTGNSTGYRGGGVSNSDAGSPTLINCTFRGNWADGGGAMYNNAYDNAMVTGCTFVGNAARETHGHGGGIFNEGRLTVVNCAFIWNRAEYGDGAGIYNYHDLVLTNCTFSGNRARYSGGAVYNDWAEPTLANCTFAGNRAVYGDGGGLYSDGDGVLANCVLWGNTDSGSPDESAQVFVGDGWSLAVDYSCIQGWTGSLGGVGNRGDDPLFVDADGPDNIVGTSDDNLRLLPASPCINVGDPTFVLTPGETDFDGYPRVLCSRIDMGAFEYGIGDCNCNRTVDLSDFAEWPGCMGGPGAGAYAAGCEAFDFKYDGFIDLSDYSGFLSAFEWP